MTYLLLISRKYSFFKKNLKQLSLVFFIVCMAIQVVQSQQWVDKKYTYDSLLNVTYGTAVNFNGELETLQMDIYLPDCDDITHTSKRPLLMWIHGGAFLAGDKNDASIQALCKNFAKRGYVTASIDYRLGFIADEADWQCNYPNYSCVFATDSTEWARAYYRAVQDGKGALRYLINRHEAYRIDTNNIFVAGESAGAFTALGVGLLDTLTERPLETFALPDAALPHPNTLDCSYNQNITFNGDAIPRPDLGGIDGEIEPTNINYRIKGIGNMYGAMRSDLLKVIPTNKTKPAIYSFHRPCDLIVPIDSNFVYWGLNWCFTNGYNCLGIANNEMMLYGSRAFSNWNTTNGYGYTIQDEFPNVNFPFNFLFGEGSCLDQVNNPCHAYDNKALRENNLAVFFSDKITTHLICDTALISSLQEINFDETSIYPNPVSSILKLEGKRIHELKSVVLFNSLGRKIYAKTVNKEEEILIDISNFSKGLYILHLKNNNGAIKNFKFIKK